MSRPTQTLLGEPFLSVVIVAFRSGRHLQACVDALARQSDAGFEVVVVDNACPDNCTAPLALPDERFRVVRSKTNRGFSGGCNLGFRESRLPWVACLNPDALARPNWVAEVRRAAERYGQGCAFGSTQLRLGRPEEVDGFGDVLSLWGLAWRGGEGSPAENLPDTDGEVLSPCAAAAVYPRGAVEAVGGFDEAYFLYMEDLDLGLRLRAHGLRVVQLRRAVVEHAGSEGSDTSETLPRLQTARNMPRLLVKNLPLPILVLALPLSVAARAYLDMRHRRHQPDTEPTLETYLRSAFSPQNWRARKSVRQMSVRGLWKYLSFNPRAARRTPVRVRPME